MSDWIETFKGVVLASEYDSEAHMNTLLYVTRFDQATWFLLHAIGITPASMKQRKRRVAVVRQEFSYHGELAGGELIVVRSGFVAVGKKFFRIIHQMHDDASGRMVATGYHTLVQASLKTGKSVILEPGQRKAAKDHLITVNDAGRTGLD